MQRVARDVAPKPLMSIMYEGCMESGKDVSAGGAMYNYGPGVVWTGLATYADNIAADIIDYTEHIHLNFKTLYSHRSTGTLSISNNTPFGEMTGASANGRKAWTPLSNGISPSQGADHRGPTAIIKSVSKLSNDAMNIGMVHNFKLMSGLLDTPRARTASSRCCERIFLVDNATGEGIPELRAYLEEDVPTISLEEAKRRQRLGLRDWEPLPAGA